MLFLGLARVGRPTIFVCGILALFELLSRIEIGGPTN